MTLHLACDINTETERKGNDMGQQEIENVRNDTSEAQERYALAPLRELNLENESDLNAYYQMLTHPSNIEHVESPPEDSADLKRKLLSNATFTYVAENMLGEIVGAGGIKDAEEGQHNHRLVRVVVHPDHKGTNIEKNVLSALTDKAFATSARDERERIKLEMSVVRDVDDFHRILPILEDLGFRPLHIVLNQVDAFDQRLGQIVVKPIERWEIMRETWLMKKAVGEKVDEPQS